MWRLIMTFLAVISLANSASKSKAAQLIFEPASGTYGDGALLPTGYGDRIAATVQDGFKYDLNGGATPNVVARFGPTDGLIELYSWAGGFGDLNNVLIAREPFPFELQLIADPGFEVTLHSFDMAGWPFLDFPSIASVSVTDGLGNVLYSQSNVYVEGDGKAPQHTHFSFQSISGPELRIKFDSTNDGHGNVLDSDDVGIDNISFTQSQVPEPCSLKLLLLISAIRWRRRQCVRRSFV